MPSLWHLISCAEVRWGDMYMWSLGPHCLKDPIWGSVTHYLFLTTKSGNRGLIVSWNYMKDNATVPVEITIGLKWHLVYVCWFIAHICTYVIIINRSKNPLYRLILLSQKHDRRLFQFFQSLPCIRFLPQKHKNWVNWSMVNRFCDQMFLKCLLFDE